jgi:Ala-tRNA(Pro) deacylase
MTLPQPEAQAPEPLPTSPAQLLQRLDSLDIKYTAYEHEAVFTVAESSKIKDEMDGLACRNLFLRDKKEVMFLITAANETKIDLKKLPGLLGCEKLSFGSPDRLWRHLGVRPGSVCPFAVINDKDLAVRMVLDKTMMQAGLVNVHPLENTQSVALAPADLVKFLRETGHEPLVLDLSPAAPDEI